MQGQLQVLAGGRDARSKMAAKLDPDVLKAHRLAKLAGHTGRPSPTKTWEKAIDSIARADVQFVFYIVFLAMFVSLTSSCRYPDEYFFSNDLRSTYITQGFDGDHDTFPDINRFADFWEWTYWVLVPGLFSRTGNPQFSDDPAEGWPNQAEDHDGLLPFSMDELKRQSSYHDFSGVQFRQLRVKPQVMKNDEGIEYQRNPTLMDVPMEGLDADFEDKLDKADFGYNTAFKYYSTEDLQDVEGNFITPFSYSDQDYVGGGHAAFMAPFYSKRLLEDYEGPATEFDPYDGWSWREIKTQYYDPEANYRCLRTSLNGVDIKQTCDVDPNGSKCKDLAYEFVKDLKEGHWLDWRTRFVQITLMLKSPNAKMNANMRLYLEMPGDGGILTSYKIDLSPNTKEQKDDILLYRTWILFFISFQLFFEGLELFRMRLVYWKDGWNWLDAINLALMIYSISLLDNSILEYDDAGLDFNRDYWNSLPPGALQLARNTGYLSDARINANFQSARVSLAINIMLQFLKLIKFLINIFPSMELVVNVLREALPNIMYYLITIGLSTAAASFYMNMVLGSNIADFYSIQRSFLSIARSIFGDFDIDSVDDVTDSNSISIFYLVYLCIMTWIIVSYFFSILADAQEQVQERMEIHEEEHGKKVHPVVAQIEASNPSPFLTILRYPKTCVCVLGGLLMLSFPFAPFARFICHCPPSGYCETFREKRNSRG